MTSVDKGSVLTAYDDVRNDTTDTTWATFSYTESVIAHSESGVDYDEFLTKLTADERLFAFLRMTSGDELSKRAKFCLITWIGENVSPLQRARMGMDKMLVKEIVQNVAIEIQTSEIDDVMEKEVMTAITKAGGANYGTGERD